MLIYLQYLYKCIKNRELCDNKTVLDVRQFIFKAPKIELHIHLEGSLSLHYWRHRFPSIHKEICRFNSISYRNLPLFLEYMEKIHKALSTPFHYYSACLDVLDQLIAENIKYAEITWAPGGIWEFHKVEPSIVFKGIKLALEERRHLVDAKILVDLIRDQPSSINQMIVNWLKQCKCLEIVGINVGGNEEKSVVDNIMPVIEQVRDLELGISIHSGESTCEKVIIHTLDQIHPHRIGHGTTLKTNKGFDRIIDQKIHVEACPTSNYSLGYIRNKADHPVFLNNKISGSINTDDRTFFSKTLTDEIVDLIENQIITVNQIAKMQIQATIHSFEKRRLGGLNIISDYWSKLA